MKIKLLGSFQNEGSSRVSKGRLEDVKLINDMITYYREGDFEPYDDFKLINTMIMDDSEILGVGFYHND